MSSTTTTLSSTKASSTSSNASTVSSTTATSKSSGSTSNSGSTTSTSKSSSKSSSTSKATTSMPKISTTSTTAATSSTWTTPTITPPSAADNPNVWRTDSPSGLVFIAVGAVAAFIFLCILLFLLIRKLMARKAAKQTLSLSDSNSSSFGKGSVSGSAEKLINPFYNPISQTTTRNKSATKLPLLYENNLINNSVSDLSDMHIRPAENLYSTLDANDNNKRRSMFVSPTAEVMNLQKKQQHQRMMSSLSNAGTQDDSYYSGPSRPYNTESLVDNQTDISITSPGGNTVSPEQINATRAPNRQSKTIPSVFLDSMFED